MSQTTTQLFLAIDGGGTKTHVWCTDQDGTVLGEGRSGAMSLAATTPKEAVKNLLQAISQATNAYEYHSFDGIAIGLAGVDTHAEVQEAHGLFETALKEHLAFEHFTLVNDVEIALLSGATRPNAIALISGTGSNCYGHNAHGKDAKVGGMDYLLSDQGSGFEIGQQVLRAAVKSFDGRDRKTILEDLVCKHFHIASIDELKNAVYHPPLNKTQIGQLAALCFTALKEQDTKANEIISHAVWELVEMVQTVVQRLELENTQTDLVLVGGIATDPHIKHLLSLQLGVKYPHLHFVIPQHPSVYGALKLAMQSVGRSPAR